MVTTEVGRAVARADTGIVERFWRRLMPLLEERQVIPFIGSDLLVQSPEGSRIPNWRWLAQRVGRQLGLAPEANQDLDSVACQYLKQADASIDEVYAAVQTVVRDEELPRIPESLERLARIAAFSLYVTTVLDPLLENALAAPAAKRRQPVHSLAYGLNASFDDLPNDLDKLDRPAVYYLLGRASAVRGRCAVTDEDVLEFIRNLHIPERQPTRLFQALASKRVLLIGSGFPGWLMRFVLRICKEDKLWAVRGKSGFIADGRASADADLQRYLVQHCGHTLYPGQGPEAFIDELWERWQACHPPDNGSHSGVNEQPAVPKGGLVFLSYASEDRAIAERLCTELESNGIEAWFDREALRPGDRWRERILDGIDQAVAFIPILSRSVLTRGPREFRAEWERALNVERQLPRPAGGTARNFIIPTVVDDVSINAPGIREYFAEFQAQQLVWNGGNSLPDQVVSILRTIVRAARKARGDGQ